MLGIVEWKLVVIVGTILVMAIAIVAIVGMFETPYISPTECTEMNGVVCDNQATCPTKSLGFVKKGTLLSICCEERCGEVE
jgi:hypothetical protein